MLMILLALLAGFQPEATRRALPQPEGRGAALSQLLALSPAELTRACQDPQLPPLLGLIAQDSAASHAHRVQAIRALALLGGADEIALSALEGLLRAEDGPEAVALARHAALTLRQLKATARLTLALDAADPEVRAHAAAAGAGGGRLCALLKADPWPEVRRAAAVGLAAEHADCLAAAFDDEHRVAIVAIEAAGRAGRPALKAPLTALAGDRRRAPLLRASALGALGALGDLGPARIVIEAHLKRGGILPLVEGAVRAAQLHGGEEGRALLKIALGSKSDRVRLITGRALLALGERAAVEAARVDWRGRARARIDAALLQADKEAPTLGDSIEMIADDPE